MPLDRRRPAGLACRPVLAMSGVPHPFTAPLKRHDPHHITEDIQKFSHGRSPSASIRRPLAPAFKRV